MTSQDIKKKKINQLLISLISVIARSKGYRYTLSPDKRTASYTSLKPLGLLAFFMIIS